MGKTLFEKVWEKHKIKTLKTGGDQLFISNHLLHEVTSPQAFEMLREKGIKVKYPSLVTSTVDHIIPTDDISRPFKDSQAEIMISALENNVKEFGIEFFNSGSGKQGVIHITPPELGKIWPGQIVVCGDSHTCTHGAFGALSFGIGTTQVSHVLATQTLSMNKLKVRKIVFGGELGKGVTAKDVVLHMIRILGVEGGVGYVYEYAGPVIEKMNMEERMTLCNMSVEGGARAGYVNPDEVTFDYLRGREYAPSESEFENYVNAWKEIASDADADFDDEIEIDCSKIEPTITWGINPEQAIGISETLPTLEFFEESQEEIDDAYNYMGLVAGKPIVGTEVDVVFIGSCTNGRLSDLRDAARILEGKKVTIKTLVVPGSEKVKKDAEKLGLDKIFTEAGCEWRSPGCSMCLAMNPDKLVGKERSVSTSNRNFKGRQGSPEGRTHLASPMTAAASAIAGKIVDVRDYL
ncbi:3-isopropylmalate dehydratase large subunit [archaeon D22]|nr:3-isopropylmalate dehydratase large subunit [archaeon D22]